MEYSSKKGLIETVLIVSYEKIGKDNKSVLQTHQTFCFDDVLMMFAVASKWSPVEVN